MLRSFARSASVLATPSASARVVLPLRRCFSEVLYAKSHEWVKLDSGIATIGISGHAQEKLGDVVFVELPETGSEIEASESFSNVESVKAVSGVYTPFAGEVVEANESLTDEPSLINSDPMGKGWIAKIKVSDESPKSELMSQEAYDKFLETCD
eukprot:JP448062.1.p1 GENE.JP448062.1~~JP448062.1.p1  ORF type:complete len:154 (+),score=44.75 JP448062.1:16-477(+)